MKALDIPHPGTEIYCRRPYTRILTLLALRLFRLQYFDFAMRKGLFTKIFPGPFCLLNTQMCQIISYSYSTYAFFNLRQLT